MSYDVEIKYDDEEEISSEPDTLPIISRPSDEITLPSAISVPFEEKTLKSNSNTIIIFSLIVAALSMLLAIVALLYK